LGKLGDLARSPDGKLVALIEGEKVIWLDATTSEEIGSVNLGDDWLCCVAFSPDARWIIVDDVFIIVDDVFGIGVIDTVDGSVRKCCGGTNGFGFGHTFSDDSRYIAYGGEADTTGGPYDFVGVYDLETDSNIETEADRLRRTQRAAKEETSFRDWNQNYPVLNPHNYHTMTPPAFSPDNRWLAAGYHDSHNDILYLWGLKSGEEQLTFQHPAKINSVDFSSDGRYLATGCDDGLVRLFNPTTGRLEKKLTGFVDRITYVQFSPDGRQITISINDQPDQIYDLLSDTIEVSEPVATDPDPFLLSMHMEGYADGDGVLFSPDGHSLAMGGQSIQLWDLDTHQVITSFENPYGRLLGWSFSSDGASLAGITRYGDVLVWDVSSSELILTLTKEMLEAGQVLYASGGIGPGIGAGVFTNQGLAFSPDGKQLAFGNGNAIEIWDIAGASKVTSLIQPKSPAYATRVSFSTDGKYLYAALNRNQDAQIWDLQTGQLRNAFSATDLNGPLFARNNYADENYWIERMKITGLSCGTWKRVTCSSCLPRLAQPNPCVLARMGKS